MSAAPDSLAMLTPKLGGPTAIPRPKRKKETPMQKAISSWIHSLASPPDPKTLKQFTAKISTSYITYGSLCLLPSTAFDLIPTTHPDLPALYTLINHHLHTTHIATTLPIPLHTPTLDLLTTSSPLNPNTLRRPSNFTPLSGPFGPSTCSSPPTPSDFTNAYWTSTKQNGIFQTWSPRWTMFSRGNISEKARLLSLASITGSEGQGCTVVDLYIGIGYFAFSYLKAGVGLVLGWEVNGWSVEGARRGAVGNGWGVKVVGGEDGEEEEVGKNGKRLVCFWEDNRKAQRRLEGVRGRVPPVRHVNCGLLPTSRGSWDVAVAVLDPELGGWIHVHENWGVGEIENKVEALREEMQRLVCDERRKVGIEHVNRLKSYAPGVIHCVVDVYIPPRISES